MKPNHDPSFVPARPPGRKWWIATSVLHLVSAGVHALGAVACLHWLSRANSDSYYEAHQDADPDVMMLGMGLVLGLAGCCVLAAIYSFVAFLVTLCFSQVGPAMLFFSLPVSCAAALGSAAELVPPAGTFGVLVRAAPGFFVAAGVAAPIVAMQQPQRAPRPRPGFPPAPRSGPGSPYPGIRP
ncbi:hypothetical protein [Flexivirga caeni]|uniref:Uncharacterized protein n=1 Tax=Flexivirga caeni TaxID=2294115 RepID=A0A3M9M461_9MICO|nr:hypothetical protein [Flexivirga caeni]RNI20339.1 hypothetical protein EFY87_15460 [Flexivirga caeni]